MTTSIIPAVIVRPARREDCPRMFELIKELAEYERAPEQVTVDIAQFEECGFGAEPVWWAHVAGVKLPDEEEQVVGFALYYIRYSTWQGKKMYLEDILVTEAWRGRGIGTLLMDAIVRDAKEKGYPGITWQVLEWNEPAIKFYEKYNPRFDGEWVNVMLNF